MSSDVGGVLFAELNTKGLIFNGYRNNDISNFIQPYQQLIQIMSPVVVSAKKVFRARKIDMSKDVGTGKGIYIQNGKLYGGFDESNSRIAPAQYCRLQRLNREKEQVFYIAEESDTAIKEMKPDSGESFSLAEFEINSKIRVLDFSAYTIDEQHDVITDDMENAFQMDTNLSARQLYYGIQKLFTILDSSEEFYNISNIICDLLKSDSRIDGIRYQSYYKGHNLGIWKYRASDYLFRGSTIK